MRSFSPQLMGRETNEAMAGALTRSPLCSCLNCIQPHICKGESSIIGVASLGGRIYGSLSRKNDGRSNRMADGQVK